MKGHLLIDHEIFQFLASRRSLGIEAGPGPAGPELQRSGQAVVIQVGLPRSGRPGKFAGAAQGSLDGQHFTGHGGPPGNLQWPRRRRSFFGRSCRRKDQTAVRTASPDAGRQKDLPGRPLPFRQGEQLLYLPPTDLFGRNIFREGPVGHPAPQRCRQRCQCSAIQKQFSPFAPDRPLVSVLHRLIKIGPVSCGQHSQIGQRTSQTRIVVLFQVWNQLQPDPVPGIDGLQIA